MILYPSIDNLLEEVNSKYTLVTLSAKRARELQEGATPMFLEAVSNKHVGTALEEIQEGLLKPTE